MSHEFDKYVGALKYVPYTDYFICTRCGLIVYKRKKGQKDKLRISNENEIPSRFWQKSPDLINCRETIIAGIIE